MDDEDSQDELIYKSPFHGKGKKPATSVSSDEEDNSEDGEDSQEGETDSDSDEDEEDSSVDEEEENGEEEDEGRAHEEAENDMEGAVGSKSPDFSGMTSDEDAEKCPICLNTFHVQPVATPENCGHYFCVDCILEWSKNLNSCPVDRIVFNKILMRKCFGGEVLKAITVKDKATAKEVNLEEVGLDQTCCEVCRGSDREDRLLLCDGCDAGYHMECLTPPLDSVPVEEWFCPRCSPNNRNTRTEQSSEDENNVLPTTSRSVLGSSRPTRAIARTQHSERVRSNVNRHRITQARTAAQLTPRYLMESTWLDQTINAVVAGLNTAVYVRDLTPRPLFRNRRRRVKRRKTKKDLGSKKAANKGVKGKTTINGVRRRKRKRTRRKSRTKLVPKKVTTSRGRIAHSLGIKKPVNSSSIPSVYRPLEQTLGRMRADIGAASLSIHGDPFDFDPFDNEDEQMQQAPGPSCLLEAKRRGLSRSALRSHQPVARPITAGLPRRAHSIPQVEEVAEAAPVTDLLGSILTGQNLLLMDSSNVVIKRDGSLIPKPVSLSLPRNSISGVSTSGETGSTLSTGTGFSQSNRSPTPSSSSSSSSSHTSSILKRPSSSHTSPHPCTYPLTTIPPSPPTSLTVPSVHGQLRLQTPLSHRPVPSHSVETEHNQRGTRGFRGQPPTAAQHGAFESRLGERRDTPPVKKPPLKPVWEDLSGLPKIPKIKRESSSAVHGSGGSSSYNLPASSITSLAGDKGQKHSVDQQRTSANHQSSRVESQRHRLDRTGPSSSFSSSFFASSSSSSESSNPRPSSSSSAISFQISASGKPWHARRYSSGEPTLPAKEEESGKRTKKDKLMLLLPHSKAKNTFEKSEVYDPFNPTGSDSSESEPEDNKPEINAQSTTSTLPLMEQNECAVLQIKTEPEDLGPLWNEEISGMCVQVKEEPTSFKDDPWPVATEHMQMQSESHASVAAYSASPPLSDAESIGAPESPCVQAFCFSRSSSTSSHHSDNKVKTEVKAEPEDEPEFKSEPEDLKGNGAHDEVPSVASCSDVSHMSKKKEVLSPFPQPKEEGSLLESASQSPRSKSFLMKCSHKKKHSGSEDRRRSRSRSPIHRHSRSRSKEKRCSRSGSKEERQSHTGSKEKRLSCSKSKDRRRSRSRSNEKRSRSRSREKRRSRSRSKDKTQSHSRSTEKQRSRSRSKDRRPPHSRDRWRSTRSSSNESSRKRKLKRDDHERDECKDRHKKTKENIRSRSRSTSRSQERKAEPKFANRSSSPSKDGSELMTKLKRARSNSGEQRWSADVPVGSCQKENNANKCAASISIEENEPNHSSDNITPMVKENSEESIGNEGETKFLEQNSDASPQDEKKTNDILESQKQVKLEQIWLDDDDDNDDVPDNTYCDDALIIDLYPPGPALMDCKQETGSETTCLTEVSEGEMEVKPLQAPCPVKQESVDSSDDDINVDYLIDNLDFIKKEMKEVSVTGSADVEPQSVIQDVSTGAKQEMESALVMAGTKAKSQGKRVTWNIQEPQSPQPEKRSKLALFKLKLKQEGSRKVSSATFSQSSGQEAAPVQVGGKPAMSLNALSQEEQSTPSREGFKSCKGEVLQDSHQKDKYMQKLHMQERAIEEVKLAIKPFYQKRDITKEEYKEILKKAVQKVCHSKSGEINPVKVANLVKAYVEKYKYIRKHHKLGNVEQSQSAEGPKDSETSGR
ncbi:PHD and RING finger domain-containing protein 1 isoform X2 [Hoplias malabaricus]|uniref:PHD and RING finger domain-containing protein 1 isoform X2 n=1 Tax=Hoplias malabaricus TaxID=27720 RepID=UPI00346328CE